MSQTDAEEHDLNDVAAYAEGRLVGAERTLVAAHLSTCESCRATLAVLLREGASAPDARKPATASVWLPLAAMMAIAVGGGWLAYRSRQPLSPPAAVPASPSTPAETPASPGTVAPPTPQTVPPSTPPAPVDPDRRRAADVRRIGDKTFRLVAGEWIDTSYDRFDLLETVTIRTREEQQLMLRRIPALQPFQALGDRVTVVHERVVYRFELSPPPR